MKTFGQLLHVEEIHRDGAHYRLAILRVQGGLHGKWSCDSCIAEDDQDRTHPTLDECLASIKDAIERHHAANHCGD